MEQRHRYDLPNRQKRRATLQPVLKKQGGDKSIPQQMDSNTTKGDPTIRRPKDKTGNTGAPQYLLCLTKAVRDKTESTKQLESIPTKYHEFTQLFQNKLTTRLPEHNIYDHEIPLQPGQQPKFSAIYGLNEKRLKALREYLDENLKKKYIQPSQSPTEYPILFIPKKNSKLQLYVDYR